MLPLPTEMLKSADQGNRLSYHNTLPLNCQHENKTEALRLYLDYNLSFSSC